MPYCQNCGTEYQEGAKFCPSCGKPIAEQTTPPTPPQQQAQTSGGPKQPEKKLGCLFWIVMILFAPAALIWALTLKKDHPQRKLGIIIPSVLMAIFIIVAIIPSEEDKISKSVSAKTKAPTTLQSTTEKVEAPATSLSGSTTSSSMKRAAQAYFTTLTKQTATVGNALEEIGQLSQNPQFGSEDWRLKMALQLTIIRDAYKKATEIEPPNSVTNIHHKYIQGMKHFNTYTTLQAQGIDKLDSDLLKRAEKEMQSGNELIVEATELISEFTETQK